MAGYLESSLGPGRTGGAQVDCRASVRLPGQAVLACMQYNGQVCHFQVVEREDVFESKVDRWPEAGGTRKGNGPPRQLVRVLYVTCFPNHTVVGTTTSHHQSKIKRSSPRFIIRCLSKLISVKFFDALIK